MPPTSLVKSILKPASSSLKTIVSANDPEIEATKRQHDRNMTIALQHAHLLQHQRNYSAQILSSIETLLDYPPGTLATSNDASDFLDMIALFQPVNFDELVEERRIDGKCGYALCSNAPRGQTVGAAAAWKLAKGKSDFCSEGCVAKAKFVKTQLSSVPAWERVPGQQPVVQLHESDRWLLPEEMHALDESQVQSMQQRIADNDELAMERGEQAISLLPGRVMADRIVEKHAIPITSRVQFHPAAGNADLASPTTIEGYRPRLLPKSTSNSRLTEYLSDNEDQDDDEYVDEGPFPGGAIAPSVPTQKDEDEEQAWRDMAASMPLRLKGISEAEGGV